MALSRVKALSGLHIVNFDANAIRKSCSEDDEMSRLRTKLLQSVQPLQCFPCTSHVTIALLNVRSIGAKVADIKADIELLSANILCFCETWLSPAQPSPDIKGVIEQKMISRVEYCLVYRLACNHVEQQHLHQMVLRVWQQVCKFKAAIASSSSV